jgi:hypothetical protein
VDWKHLPEDRDQWRVLVDTVMNLWVPQKLLKADSASWSFQSRGVVTHS